MGAGALVPGAGGFGPGGAFFGGAGMGGVGAGPPMGGVVPGPGAAMGAMGHAMGFPGFGAVPGGGGFFGPGARGFSALGAGPRGFLPPGGLGVIGGVGYTPKMLKVNIEELKSGLKDKNAPFGVDLLLPKVGGSARKTNKDYTKGKLPELIDIIIEAGAKLFVSAVVCGTQANFALLATSRIMHDTDFLLQHIFNRIFLANCFLASVGYLPLPFSQHIFCATKQSSIWETSISVFNFRCYFSLMQETTALKSLTKYRY